jgi:hypothetical protein
LGVVEDPVAEIHANSVGSSTGVDSMHASSELEDGFLNILGNGGLVSMEYINEDGPAIELFCSLLWSGRVAYVAGGESICVGHGGGVSSLGQFRLAHALENLLVFGMSFAADGERRESFAEDIAISTGLEGAEDLINNLGGQSRQVSGEDRDWGVIGTFLDVATKDGILLSFGCLGEDLVDFRDVVVISGSGHLVHVGGKVFPIAVSEGLLGSVTFEL